MGIQHEIGVMQVTCRKSDGQAREVPSATVKHRESHLEK
jgi:hypothetical protein